MKPAPFKYVRPHSVDEALALLSEHGDDAKVLAGGQSLVPLMNMRMAQPSVLIDINGLTDLSGIAHEGPQLQIGALTRQVDVERSAEVTRRLPVIGEGLRHVAHIGIRSRGTFGGSVAHADPASELPALVLALDGELVVRSAQGERIVPAEDFFRSYFTTAMEPTEILTAVRVSGPSSHRWAFLEVARRRGDFALVGVITVLELGEHRRCQRARLALFGVSDVPVRARAAEDHLTSATVADDGAIDEAARLAAAGLTPSSDIHASAEYRRKVAEVLVRRALRTAVQGGERA